MTLKRLSLAAAVLLPMLAVGVLIVETWTPPAHPVHTPGGAAVSAHFADGFVWLRGKVPPPSTSLDQVRCQASYPGSGATCSDMARLSQEMWPGLTQSPQTLYVPFSGESLASSQGVNVEYERSTQTVTVHLYEARPLLVLLHHYDPTAGAQLAPRVDLLMVSTAGMTPGTISVWEDGWIERITGDERDGEGMLGTVAIS